MYKTNIKGFTLIEILFVIAILSVLASLGLSVLQQRAQQLKVERTALQMQQILQAGMSYKSDKSAWPTSITQTDFVPYLPVNSSSNPWGYAYSCGKAANREVFQVKVQVPGSASNTKIADQIVALLPNAEKDVTTDPTKVYVLTEVSGTGSGTTDDKMVFKDISPIITVYDSTDSAHSPRFNGNGVYTTEKNISITCSPGMKGYLLFLTKQIYPGEDYSTGTRNIRNLEYVYDCEYSPGGTVASCGITVTFQAAESFSGSTSPTIKPATLNRPPAPTKGGGYTGTGYLSFQYMTYCKKI